MCNAVHAVRDVMHLVAGKGSGSVIGGQLYEAYGGKQTFRYYGFSAIALLAFYVITTAVIGPPQRKSDPSRTENIEDEQTKPNIDDKK